MRRNLKNNKYREILFWLLLLSSWQFLASPGTRNGIIGAFGTAAFLLFAWANLDRFDRLGFEYACWRSVQARIWAFAIASGPIAGVTVSWIACVSGEMIRLSNDRKLLLLQVTLGPVLEEIVFRGYVFALLLWASVRLGRGRWKPWVVVIASVLFAVVHLMHPGVNWLQLACITSTGALYGWIRYFSRSAAPAAVSHATYNLTLYAIAGILQAKTRGW